MSPLAGALLGLALLAALEDWWAVATASRRVEIVAKPLVVAALLAGSLVLVPESEPERGWIAVGLACSLAGDVALLVRGDRRREAAAFGAGLGAFLLAHLAYLVAFAGVQRSPGGLAVAALLAWVVATFVGGPIVRGATRTRGAFVGGGVAVYLLVISGMLAAAAGTGDLRAAAGGLLFYVSDGILGWDRFVRHLARGRLATHVTYHLGQALIVLSLLA